MAKFTVFYKNQLEEECDEMPDCLCTGSFIRMETGDGTDWWRTVAWDCHVKIKAHQVPDNIKAICLLLDIQI